ncbi:MAG TPA: XrtA system polysaccharide deacetylase [Gemmataceae bacterium]|nr:XrtA system polysaccharide deacetylase [Gemmataceae bacterium]
MAQTSIKEWRQDAPHAREEVASEAPAASEARQGSQVVLSFDVEEHYRIEAAAGLEISEAQKAYYGDRLEVSTRWILDQLDRHEIKATFFVVGELTRRHTKLIRTMARAGHEVASHSWEHRRLHSMTPEGFRDDLRKSKDALEQVTGQEVVGYRAPTFSIVRQTAWALDILAEEGFEYDSSIYPVWHDRYGVPGAPRGPFWAKGANGGILELPPATWRVLWNNVPVGGGGYFRLLPLWFMRRALKQVEKMCDPPVAMLYFHPWEFDPGQEQLPVGWMNRLRTYVGIDRSRERFKALLASCQFVRAMDAANALDSRREVLATFVAGQA